MDCPDALEFWTADAVAECVSQVRERSSLAGAAGSGAALPRTWQVALIGQAAVWGLVTAAIGQQVVDQSAAAQSDALSLDGGLGQEA